MQLGCKIRSADTNTHSHRHRHRCSADTHTHNLSMKSRGHTFLTPHSLGNGDAVGVGP